MNHIIVDIEATCWKSWRNSDEMEIIEIGAVKLSPELEVVSEFGRFVKPIIHPKLSSFCTKLTSITQAEVDGAERFSAVFPDFLDWIGHKPYHWYSWGNYDRKQFVLDVARHGQSWPTVESAHTNLKPLFAEKRGLEKPIGMMKALRVMEIEFAGTHHRGIDDARHIAKIAQQILPKPA